MIEKTTLENGLTVITDHVPWVETVACGLWIGAGSIYEDAANNGAAHFFEHMAFKGTPKRTAREVSLAIERVGGYLNAYTSREVTAYHAKALKGELGLLVDVLSDIIQHLLLDATEMENERTVILQELMQSIDTPDDIVFDYFQEAVFKGSSYARPILGTEESIKALTPAMLQGFLDRFYGPAHTVAVASGNVSHSDHLAAVKAYYRKSGGERNVSVGKPTYCGGIDHHQRDGLRQAQVVWGYEAPPRQTPEGFAMRINNLILSGGMSARLVYEVREQLGLVYTINSFYHPYQDAGLWGVYAGTSPEKVTKVIEKTLKHMHALADEGPSDAEMDQVRQQVQAHTHMLWESVSTRARMIGEYFTYRHAVIDPQEELEKLCAVTKDQLRSNMQALLKQRPTCSVLADKATMPTDAQLAQWGVR